MSSQAQTGSPDVRATPDPSPSPSGTGAETAGDWQVTAAFWIFVAVCFVMFVFYAYVGRHIWFSVGAAGDEWDFLAKRHLSIHDLLEQHGGHFVALPLIVYRAMFNIFGLRSYRPYQFLVLGLHITAGCQLRALMRRRKVDPWIATAAASLFICFGSAGQDILWAFQIAFTGALVFGLAELLCLDHDGEIDRRDWFALAFGFAAVTCSGVGVAMVAVAGVATGIRRGWRIAAFHILPLAAVYAAWASHYGNSIITKDKVEILQWVWHGVWSVFAQLGQLPVLGFVFAAVLVGGLVLGWRSRSGVERREWVALPVGMLAGAIGFLALTGITRAWTGAQFASSSRYMHVVAALVLVPLAMAINEIVRHAIGRNRYVIVGVAVVLLVVGIPSNLSKTLDSFPTTAFFKNYQQMMLSVPRMPIAREVPPGLRPDPNQAPQVTMRWLLQGVDEGWLPSPGPSTPQMTATNTLRLSLQEIDDNPKRSCPPLGKRTVIHLARGQSLVLHGSFFVQLLPPTTPVVSALVTFGATFFGPLGDRTVKAVVQPLSLRFIPRTPAASAC